MTGACEELEASAAQRRGSHPRQRVQMRAGSCESSGTFVLTFTHLTHDGEPRNEMQARSCQR